MKKHSCYGLFFEKLVLKMHFGMSFLRTFDLDSLSNIMCNIYIQVLVKQNLYYVLYLFWKYIFELFEMYLA